MIDAVFNTLTANVGFMTYFGLTPSSSPLDIEKRIIQGMESDSTLSATVIPRVYLYVKPGRFGRNHLVFEGKFCCDIVAKTSKQARDIANVIYSLFHDKHISDANFHSYLCVLAYDGDFATGEAGMKGWQAIYDVDYFRGN